MVELTGKEKKKNKPKKERKKKWKREDKNNHIIQEKCTVN